MPAPLTKLQQSVLNAIKALTVDSVPPSYEELRVALGMKSKGQIAAQLANLKAKGRIDMGRGHRSIRILEPDTEPQALAHRTPEELARVIEDAALAMSDQMGGGHAANYLLRVLQRLRARDRAQGITSKGAAESRRRRAAPNGFPINKPKS